MTRLPQHRAPRSGPQDTAGMTPAPAPGALNCIRYPVRSVMLRAALPPLCLGRHSRSSSWAARRPPLLPRPRRQQPQGLRGPLPSSCRMATDPWRSSWGLGAAVWKNGEVTRSGQDHSETWRFMCEEGYIHCYQTSATWQLSTGCLGKGQRMSFRFKQPSPCVNRLQTPIEARTASFAIKPEKIRSLLGKTRSNPHAAVPYIRSDSIKSRHNLSQLSKPSLQT